MSEKELKKLLAAMDKIYELLCRYERETEELSAVDTEQDEEITAALSKRSETIEKLKKIQPQLFDLVSKQEPEESLLLRNIMNGGSFTKRLNEDEKLIQQKAINIHSLQRSITEKDGSVMRRMAEKRDEAREMLLKAQEDKKKIDFYTNVDVNRVGRTFDSHS